MHAAVVTSESQTKPTVRVEIDGRVAILALDRPEKRNALNQAIVAELGAFFRRPPAGVAAAVLTTSGEHFSAGLDLNELSEASAFEGVLHSRGWYHEFNAIGHSSIPIVSALRGAVIGGGLEIAMLTHIRVADPSAYYALPEGSRGIFVGGGASVRLSRVIGVHRITDMMLTGRVYDAAEGQRIGISQYLVGDGEALDTAIGLARRIAENSPVSNYAILQALPRIAEMGPEEGLFVESLMSAVAQSSDEAKALMSEFLAGRASKVTSGSNDSNGSGPAEHGEEA